MLIGLVGKPSVGKSTFFQALSSIPVARAAYPFTTIKPNHGMGFVEVECVDKDFGVKCNPRKGFCVNSRRFVPVELLDVAGLVPGAHEGKGLGNQFLDDLRQADALIHVVDASGSINENGEAVEPGSYDPVKDVAFLEDELAYWFNGILEKNLKKIAREKDLLEALASQFAGLGIRKIAVEKSLKKLFLEKPLDSWSEGEKLLFCRSLREEGKPIVIAANKIDLPHARENMARIQAAYPNYLVVGCSAESEIAIKQAAKAGFVDYVPGDATFRILRDLTPEQSKGIDYIKRVCVQNNGTGVQSCLNRVVFDFLKYIAVFPGGAHKLEASHGNVIPDCFLMPPQSTALDFARAIHSDFADKFIKAIHAKTKRVLGADYLLQHRDVLEIAFAK